jgi:hypothetical protein
MYYQPNSLGWTMYPGVFGNSVASILQQNGKLSLHFEAAESGLQPVEVKTPPQRGLKELQFAPSPKDMFSENTILPSKVRVHSAGPVGDL